VQFRQGALGFLPTAKASNTSGTGGLNGAHDVIVALQWIQQHIYSFGGDRDRVTLFGHSSGGSLVCWLGASPLAAGLFSVCLPPAPTSSSLPLVADSSFGGVFRMPRVGSLTSCGSNAEAHRLREQHSEPGCADADAGGGLTGVGDPVGTVRWRQESAFARVWPSDQPQIHGLLECHDCGGREAPASVSWQLPLVFALGPPPCCVLVTEGEELTPWGGARVGCMQLKALPVQDLLSSWLDLRVESPLDPNSTAPVYWDATLAFIDGWVLEDWPMNVYAAGQANMQRVIVGVNSMDGILPMHSNNIDSIMTPDLQPGVSDQVHIPTRETYTSMLRK
jgi:hypothetical protein